MNSRFGQINKYPERTSKLNSKIYSIFISDKAGDTMQSLKSASLIAGKGVVGDRYFNGCGTFSERLKDNPAVELSLIEKEEIDAFNQDHKQMLNYADVRRNIVTESVRLNELVGKTFSMGNVTLKGLRLCEPCAYLAENVNELVLPHLIGRGGLRAQILTDNEISVGDLIKI